VELLTVREVAGILRIAVPKAYIVIHNLHPAAIVRVGRGDGELAGNEKILVHAWALGHLLNLEKCPGCGQGWPER
jgi:hypothetical protein